MSTQRLLGALVIAIGVLALVVGIVYFTVEAHSLPSFLGRLHGDNAHRTLRGAVALVIGVVLVGAGAAIVARPRPTR